MVGSKAPRTSISLPKISAMELRYSAWVSRRMLTTEELGAPLAETVQASDANTVKDRRETANFRMRDFRFLSDGNSDLNSSQRYRNGIERVVFLRIPYMNPGA